jgi:hypothetical protein
MVDYLSLWYTVYYANTVKIAKNDNPIRTAIVEDVVRQRCPQILAACAGAPETAYPARMSGGV